MIPARDKADNVGRWHGVSVWTNEDDLLNDQALEIIIWISSHCFAYRQKWCRKSWLQGLW